MDPMAVLPQTLADRLIESVPNISEGRRLDVIERLAMAISSVPGVHLLDRTSDASHNRSVFTLAGPAGAVADALEQLVGAAIREIDMDEHWGEHPRIGAVDVIPFVPLGDTTMDEAIDLARAFGARIATRFDLPVYLYAQAARRGDRIKLADVRRGQYEGLKVEIGQNGREPDLGPVRMHPSAGAVAVGARPFLIAYNINLDSDDVELAKRIARRVRESGGGLPKVQANGFFIDELHRAQVSMNLLDFRVTPLWRVWETVRAEAAEDGVELFESELIGLAPLAAFLEVADHAAASADPAEEPAAREPSIEERLAAAAGFLRLRDFSPMQALELRLDAAQATADRRPA
jgi:glutamate formiminotransferase / 5-formyltetrahydrofolate cyclo-ligase